MQSFDSFGALWCERVHYLLALNWYDRACDIVRAFSTFSQSLYSQFLLVNLLQKEANCKCLHAPGWAFDS